MIWIVVLGALALAGAVALVVYGVGLVHRAADVRHEADVVVGRLTEVRSLLGRLDWSSLRRD
ncbi:hypothetical protein G7085_18310 [Tessaracoccus sp. HDW20]|uniref:hypothetical protein n=1 Tax=Tessaracoccus coleopterorum TaxID=2714950 RepID=UPI0018D351DD|nr:hypothetical protein [Tessaracoccus coleopterorum]NHB85857.1 hypothetical protein [Tessaracoccus coleopterorum]